MIFLIVTLTLITSLALVYHFSSSMSSPRKRGSRKVRRLLDSCFRRNDTTDTLSKPKQGFFNPLKTLFSQSNVEIKKLIPQLEEMFLLADVGMDTTSFLIDSLKSNTSLKSTEDAFVFLKDKIEALLTPSTPFQLDQNKPQLIFFVGVNGTGKTTTIGKLSAQLTSQGKKTLLVAGDTFRAAAAEQLEIWADRSHSKFIRGGANADPASVVFDGIKKAKEENCDFILVDTAGRLHTKTPLIEELKKMVRVATRELGREPDHIFLVLDTTTGQNGLNQACVFKEACPLTGLVLTKFDSTAKGGIILSIVRETGLPIRFIGLGEGISDLKLFDAKEFVEKIFSNSFDHFV